MADEKTKMADLPVGFGDKRIETSQFDRYKGRKGVTDRIAIISTNLVRVWTYFYEGHGQKQMFRAPTDKETLDMCRDVIGEPDQRFGLVLFHYLTDENGEMIDTDRLRGKIKLWRISEARYEELSNLNRQFPLLDNGWGEPQSDLVIQCTEEQFQRMTFTPTPSAHWKSKEAWFNALKDRERKAQAKLGLAMGRKLDAEEIKTLLGVATAGVTGSTDNANDLDLGEIMDDD